MSQKVLSYDLGGTKVAAGIINSRGRILDEIREPVLFDQGKDRVIRQLAELGSELLSRHREVKKVGIASAGPLDPKNGILLNPTNFGTSEKSWGEVPIAKILKQIFKRPVHLENDAAAAVLAERWIGAGKKYRNIMMLTLGTGLGTGIICNGKLVRSGRGLHPEAGHLILKYDDPSAPCTCGNLGCAEAYLSGRNFGKRAKLKFKRQDLTPKDIADLARKKNRRALEIFKEYAEIMAVAIHNYVRLYNPEIVVFTGSFADAADLFLPETQLKLKSLLAPGKKETDLFPKIVLSQLKNEAGLIGGAYIALYPNRV